MVKPRFILIGILIFLPPVLWGAIPSFPEVPPIETLFTLEAIDDFEHRVGQPGSRGWELDHKRDRPGYALKGLHEPLLLEPGVYRMTFILRRGNYPQKGLLHDTYGVFRIEIWDITQNQRINFRELQISDFSKPNFYESRWMNFSMEGRKGHYIEPRIYWVGLANGEVESISIQKRPNVNLRTLEEKAFQIGDRLERNHLENGYVVSRKQDGSPDETGDATTYTGFYVASLAWKYAVTKDPLTKQALENGLQTLHQSIKGTIEQPLLARFVHESGQAHPQSPSKDVYMSFFLACSMALPHLTNESLKNQLIEDMDLLGTQFLEDGLTVKMGEKTVMSLTPYYTDAEIRSGIRKLFTEKDGGKKLLETLKTAQRYFPFAELWPGLKKVIKSLKQGDQERLYSLVVPTMNGILGLVERGRDILREQYRNDLFPKRYRNEYYPGKKLEKLISESLKKLPPRRRTTFKDDPRFERPSDLRILASNALISLHIIKTAAHFTQQPHFIEYYRNNLYTQDELLKTALNWYGIEEDMMKLTAGNPAADRMRKGYLSALSLYNLAQLETNTAIRERYQSILNRWWKDYRNEENPMARALTFATLNPESRPSKDPIFYELNQFPIESQGFGPLYWKKYGKLIADKLSGGMIKGFSREPVPISHRPKDSFLWQRNARRIKGDYEKDYPGTDYLFVYWFCRYHNIIPTPEQTPVSRKE